MWHSINSHQLPLRTPKTWEPNNIFNNYRLDIGCMIDTLVWDYNLHTPTAYSWNQHKCTTLPLGQLVKSPLARKKGWPGLDKTDGQSQVFLWGSQRVFWILLGALCWHWHRFSPAVRQNGGTSRVIPHKWLAVYFFLSAVSAYRFIDILVSASLIFSADLLNMSYQQLFIPVANTENGTLFVVV